MMKLLCRSRDPIFPPFPRSSFFSAGEGSQEIRCGLLFGTIETHVDKELFGFGSRSKVDLIPIVEDDDLGKELTKEIGDTR
jgi:hypothetical protein